MTGSQMIEKDRKDITRDLLLCNRCGGCRSVCPVYDVIREEWGGSRGKVEVAEAFFRGEEIADRELLRVFDLCLHCMACEESCPSGMRADEIVLAVRTEMAKRGLMPWAKKVVLKLLGSMDSVAFRIMRAFGISRKGRLQGYGTRSPVGFLYPLLGWSSKRSFPLPRAKAFLGNNPELFPATKLDGILPEESGADEILLSAVRAARARNIEKKTRVLYFIGDSINHFFPEEAESVVWVLNLIGIDVIVPVDQACCGAPFFYSGDIDSARKAAVDVVECLSAHEYKWIITSCSSGGKMLKSEYPRLFDLNDDGFFKVEWDEKSEVFYRNDDAPGSIRPQAEKLRRAGEGYLEKVEGKVRDINELLAIELIDKHNTDSEGREKDAGKLPVVTYHHPCHLGRGQGVKRQPEALLELLPGYRYVEMPDADRCCGGGGFFTFVHDDISSKVGSVKADAIAAVQPDVVATACPVCRIQLMDIISRRAEGNVESQMPLKSGISVTSPPELLASELHRIIAG
ncbi:MAG: (Fe-S)-binding protein [Bacteroidales bacterium]|nr:(Fe-S)-binding protein [Candidatus Latescibacterota bacterium]